MPASGGKGASAFLSGVVNAVVWILLSLGAKALL